MPVGLSSVGINPGSGRNIEAYDLNGDGTLWVPVSMVRNASGLIGTTNPLAVHLSDGTNVIGNDEANPLAVRLCEGGDPNSVSNPIYACLADDGGAALGTDANPLVVNHNGLSSAYYTMGSSATGAKQIKSGAGRIYGADVVFNTHSSSLYLVLMDRSTAPAVGDSILASATGVISVTAAAAGNSGIRPYVSSRSFTQGLWAFVSTTTTTLTYAASDLARVAIDYR